MSLRETLAREISPWPKPDDWFSQVEAHKAPWRRIANNYMDCVQRHCVAIELPTNERSRDIMKLLSTVAHNPNIPMETIINELQRLDSASLGDN